MVNETLSVSFEEKPYRIKGFILHVNDKGIIDEARIELTQEGEKHTWSDFILNTDDKRTDEWINLEKDDVIKQGIKYKKAHTSKRSALMEYKRVKKILDEKNNAKV